MHLIYFKERIHFEDRWYDRQDITDKAPGEWLADALLLRGDVSDIILCAAIPITHAEADAITQTARGNVAKRKEMSVRDRRLAAEDEKLPKCPYCKRPVFEFACGGARLTYHPECAERS